MKTRPISLKTLFDPKIFITNTLIVINAGIFTGMALTGDVDGMTLLRFGAQYPPAVWRGEYWRYLTPLFLHYDLFHLLFNICALFVLGQMVEPFLGGRRFLSIYLFSGILGSIVSSLVHPDHISVGASGSVFGLAGTALAATFLGVHLQKTEKVRKGFRQPLFFLLLCFILYNIVIGFFQTSIDNAAHLGGLGAGFVMGYYFTVRIMNMEAKIAFARIAYLLFSLAFALMFLYSLRPSYSPGWCLWYADNLQLLGKNEDAEKYYRRAVHMAPGENLYHRELGSFLVLQGRPRDALSEYETAFDLGGEDLDLLFRAGMTHLALGEMEKAGNYYEKTVQREFFNSKALILLGSYHRQKGELDQALDIFVRAVRLDPTSSLAFQAMLDLLTRPGAVENSENIDFIERETRRPYPRNTLYHTFLASYYRHFRHFEQAEKLYRFVLNHKTENYPLHYDLAYCLMKKGDHKEAEKEVNRFLGMMPDIDFPGFGARKNYPLMLKLRILNKMGDTETAARVRGIIEKNYRAEIKREPNVTWLNNLAYHFAVENYNIDEAVRMARKAVAIQPRAYTLDTLSWSLFRAGRLEDALESQHGALEAAKKERTLRLALSQPLDGPLALHPDEGDRMYFYHQGAILEAMGRKTEAAGALKKALQGNADFEDYEAARDLLGSVLKNMK